MCVSSPAKPMRESVSASTTVKRIPASAAAAISAARYTNQECVFLQMIKSIPFWQDLLEHASLFYAIPSLSSGSIYQPAGALSPNGDCSLVCTWYKGTIMMHVDSLQRYWHRNKEQTLRLIAVSLTLPQSTLVMFQTCLSLSQDFSWWCPLF